MDVSCAILAGGRSRRIGMDKATLKIGREMLIEIVIRKVRPIFDRIFVISKENNYDLSVPVLKDLLPYEGPSVGILSALLHSETEYIFVLGCDMPFVKKKAVLHMLKEKGNEDIVIPFTQKGFEPLHAIYRRTCISYLLKNISKGLLRIPDLFPYLVVKFINPQAFLNSDELYFFMNINTKEDLEVARRILQGNPVQRDEE